MKLSDFDYGLPAELIAQTPLEDRTGSRLMLLDKRTGEISHNLFKNIGWFLNPGDCLVINNTKVLPARLLGRCGGKPAEVLLLRRVKDDLWETLVKPGKRIKTGAVVIFGDGELTGTVEDITAEGNRLTRFSYGGIWNEVLDALGEMPVPPYITEKLDDKNRYQTVYARYDGSAAAPTAGLHFTQELLDGLQTAGVSVAELTLHVGLGTFRPVKTENVLEHKMHSEYYNIEPQEALKINGAKARGGRIVAVGTTVCRTLETLAEADCIKAGSGWTDIFIYPGYTFKTTDALVTNFHLPKSTLLMLVSAMAGRERVLEAYAAAVREGYRFFSFGDAMFIY